MKILGRVEQEAVTDLRCDICDESTRQASGNLQFGTLEAQWGYGTAHDGERYEVHLCERCFFTPSPVSNRSGGQRICSKATPSPAKWNWAWPAGTIGSATVNDGFFLDPPCLDLVVYGVANQQQAPHWPPVVAKLEYAMRAGSEICWRSASPWRQLISPPISAGFLL